MLSITNIVPWFPRSVMLQWEFEKSPPSGTYTFKIERSGSPGGPWTTAGTVIDTYTFTDDLKNEEANILSLTRELYYRVSTQIGADTVYSQIIDIDGQCETVYYGPMPVVGFTVEEKGQNEATPQTGLQTNPWRIQPRRLRLLRRKILRDEYIRLRRLNGVVFALLKRRHFGTRCPKCYDAVVREVLNSRCPICYGTSWEGGYFAPVDILGAMLPTPVTSEISPQTKDDVNVSRVQLLDFPKVNEGDILVARTTNTRYLVKQRYATKIKMLDVHQTVTVSELERNAIEYSVTV